MENLKSFKQTVFWTSFILGIWGLLPVFLQSQPNTEKRKIGFSCFFRGLLFAIMFWTIVYAMLLLIFIRIFV